jgi:hypothetical protein
MTGKPTDVQNGGFLVGLAAKGETVDEITAAASDNAYQLHAHGRWFSPDTPASSTTKTGSHDIAVICSLDVNINLSQTLLMWNDAMIGTISAHPRGFGFVMLDEGGRDLRLSAHQMKLVFQVGAWIISTITICWSVFSSLV